jgi:hypothetical protein
LSHAVDGYGELENHVSHVVFLAPPEFSSCVRHCDWSRKCKCNSKRNRCHHPRTRPDDRPSTPPKLKVNLTINSLVELNLPDFNLELNTNN